MINQYKIFDQGDLVGEISFGKDNDFKLSNSKKDFEDLLSVVSKEGLYTSECLETEENGAISHTMIKKKIESNDPLFALVLRDHLSSKGYYVVDKRADVDEEINILSKTLDLNEELKKMHENLDSLTYLEKTFLLEKMKEFSSL